MFETILGAFFGVAGIVGLIECTIDLARGRQSQKWPTVPAEIIESTVTYRAARTIVALLVAFRGLRTIRDRADDWPVQVKCLVMELAA